MVPQGYEWTVERFGQYTHTMTRACTSCPDHAGRRPQGQHDGAGAGDPSQDVITKDNAVVKVDGVVFFQVLDAAKAPYEVRNLERPSSTW
jgi:regulator of protease activity HflC (stomatin/prohibitin superfamily)